MGATLSPASGYETREHPRREVVLHTGSVSGKDRGWSTKKHHRRHKGPLRCDRMCVMSFQAANKLGPTQMLKIFTHSTPHIVLNEGGAMAAQSVVLEVFPTNTDVRPFFSLGIVSLSVCGSGQRLEVALFIIMNWGITQ